MVEAHAERSKLGDRRLAAQDLTEELAKGRIHSMRRRVGKPLGRAAPERELLPASFWREHELDSWSDRLFVVPRGRSGQGLRGYVFFTWKPDSKKFSRADASSSQLQLATTEAPVKRGRKALYAHAELAVIAYALAERRKRGEPAKTQADVARELANWCEGHSEKVPPDSILNEIVSAAFRARKRLKATPKR
jgi:hypothetical protein